MACEGSICRLFSPFNFSSIPLGTTLTVVGKSGFVYGPAKFTNFNQTTCIVTLEEHDTLSPSVTNIIRIGCDNIESVITTLG